MQTPALGLARIECCSAAPQPMTPRIDIGAAHIARLGILVKPAVYGGLQ
jgi:hypothetical protein